ncbi:MAG: hypothetical protein Q4G43_10315 [Mobilicoccus sp.]|nr:hypothetical protein [Mobilicoccus sp.]
MQRRSLALALALAVTLLSGCGTAGTTPQAAPTTAAAPSPASTDLGRPLEEIEKDRPANSGKNEQVSMERLDREGGICTLAGADATCTDVPEPYRPDAQALWERTVLFFPPEVRSPMSEFVLLPRGQGGGVAEDDQGAYLFSVGFPASGDVDHIIIHELGHAFEVTTHQDFAKRWHAKFWTDAEQKKSQDYEPDAATLDQNPLYAAKPDAFVHPYAAVNASEDFAETFRWFVLGVKPTGTSIKEQKILEMWTDPALVAARDRIQQARAEHPGPLQPVPVS